MLKNITVISLAIVLLSACAVDPDGYLKRSANNKIFDRKGFHGNKRPPLYNKKYIEKAKRNVASNSCDDDDELDDEYGYYSEHENIGLANRRMYRRMIEEDAERRQGNKKSGNKRNREYDYPVISDARYEFYEDKDNNAELKKELEEIKSMLNKATNELSNQRCPTAESLERQYNSNKAKSGKKSNNDGASNPDTIEPVKAI